MTNEIERGDIAFSYRSRVGARGVRSLGDVARLTFMLAPDRGGCSRLVVVGRKRLPDCVRHERVWALVAKVTRDPERLRDDLAPRVYTTRTRGLRVEPGARFVGEGRYAIALHDAHSHLAYALADSPGPGEAQLFNLRPEASFIVAVRNPDAPAPPGMGLPRGRRAELPPDLRARFGSRRWLALDDPTLLDHEGVELLLVGAAEDVEAELGIELDAAPRAGAARAPRGREPARTAR